MPSRIGAVEERRLASQRQGNYFVVKNREKIRYLKLTEQDHFLWDRIDGKTTFGDLVMAYFQKFGAFAFNRIGSLLEQLRNNYFLEEKPRKIFSSLRQQKEKKSATGRIMRFVRAFIQKEVPVSRLDETVTFLYKTFFWPLFTRAAKFFYLLATVAGFGCFAWILHNGGYSIVETNGSYAVGVLVLIGLQVFIILLHEGAHAFAAKAYGRDVPRGGFMIYMGMPAFFVDTTDMWLESKGRRIAVSWAGPYSELIVGGMLSAFMALFPENPANPILFKCAFLFYIGVFLNLNPLLELDGYYILVDLLEIPLLRRRSLKFVKKDLWGKLSRRETFSREEKIFTVFGILAAAYTAFALSVAAYFWQTRISGTFAELWQQGFWSRALVVLLVGTTLAPLAIALALKTWQLCRWAWGKISSSSWLASSRKAGPLFLAVAAAVCGFFFWQPWFSAPAVAVAAGAGLFAALAHAWFHGRSWLFPKSPWRELPYLFPAAAALWVLQGGLSLTGFSVEKLLPRAASLVLLGFCALRSVRHLCPRWLWAVLFFQAAFFSAAAVPFLPRFEHELHLLFAAAFLSFLAAAAVSLRETRLQKLPVRHMAEGSDEEKLEQAFLSVLATLRRSLFIFYAPPVAQAVWERGQTVLLKETPEFQKAQGWLAFKPGLSILEKARAANKAFEIAWGRVEKGLGRKWARLVLEKTFDALDWQEREILEQYVFRKEDARKGMIRAAAAGRRGLEAILKSNFLFAELKPEEISFLAEAFREERFRKGEIILRQGDPGDKFYLVKEGRVSVRIKRENGVEEEVARLGEADFFGEIALLKDVPRTATCAAATDAAVWSLDKKSFDRYVKERLAISGSVERAVGNIRLLSAMPLFREMTPTQLRQLALGFKTRRVEAGEAVIRQGERGEEFFVIEKGECAVKIGVDGGGEKTVAKLGRGEYFGEVALLTDAPRTATVEAMQPTDLLALSRGDFDRLVKKSLQASGSLEKVSSRRRLDLKKKTLAGA